MWREHYPGRVMELWIDGDPATRDVVLERLVAVSGAHELEAQSNLPEMWSTLERHGEGEVVVEHLLFTDGPDTVFEGGLRGVAADEVSLVHRSEVADPPEDEWVLMVGSEIAGWGGALGHYNPPFVDVYMEVVPDWRGRGLGGLLVHRLRGRARERGRVPAARCSPDNPASRAALLRGGLRQCGTLAARALRIR